jgi:hypothetical protein
MDNLLLADCVLLTAIQLQIIMQIMQQNYALLQLTVKQIILERIQHNCVFNHVQMDHLHINPHWSSFALINVRSKLEAQITLEMILLV